jgi:hypothetical protein
MMKPLQGKTCEGFCVFLGCTRKAGIHTISEEREDLPMSFDHADNRPVLMDPKHPTPVKTWDCSDNDVSIVRIIEGQTGDGPCEAGHPHKDVQKVKKRFRRIKNSICETKI